MSPSRQVLAATAIIVATLLGFFAYDQMVRFQEELAQAERETRNTASLLSEHLAQALETAEKTLQAVAGVRRDAALESHDAALVHGLLKAVHGGSPLFRSIGWVDAQGNRIASSLFADPPPLNIADQHHFRALRDGQAPGDRLHIASPFRSQFLDAWIILVSLRFNRPDGTFDGLVGGVIDPNYLERVYRGARLGESEVVTLLRRDGTIFFREPFDESLLGVRLPGWGTIAESVASQPIGVVQGHSLVDGTDRVVGYAVRPDGEFIATVSVTRDEALAEFWRGLAATGGRVSLTVVVLIVGGWLLFLQIRRHEGLEADLRESEARFRDFAASSGDWFWETDRQHRFVWVSDSVEKATGLPASWHYGKTRMAIAGSDQSTEDWQEHLRALRERRAFRDFEFLRRGPYGDRWMRTSGVPCFDAAGQFRGYRGSGRDVTDLRRAEQRLREAVEAIPGGFLLFDAEGRLTYVNENSAKLLPETSKMDRIGDTLESILRRALAAGLMRDVGDDPEEWVAWRLARHRAAEGRTIVHLADRIVEIVERPTHDGGVMVLRFDVTERERARQAEETARQAAEDSDRAKSDFLARMSHELRTPLNSILGFGQMLLLDPSAKLGDKQKEYCSYILKGGELLLGLVNEVLDLAGVEAGKIKLSLEPLMVTDELTQIVTAMQPVAETAGVALDPPETIEVPDVRADEQRFRQVVLNLISNAIKYNRRGGSVAVTAGQSADGMVRILVTDTGPGIPLERQQDLFKPFNRLGAEYTAVEGTGIGLALCKRLVEAMNGRIGFASEPGKGSTFWIELPAERSRSAPTESEHRPRSAPLAARCSYSLLYVEDNPANLNLMGHLVQTLPNVTMLSAPSGQLGLDLARAHRPEVIVLDLDLPDLSGFEVLERLKSQGETRDIPVIALTASAMPSDRDRGLSAGFFRYLTKPLDVNAFLESVSEALAQRGHTHRAAREPEDSDAWADAS